MGRVGRHGWLRGALLVSLAAAPAFAQSPESDLPPAHVEKPEHPEGFAFPEVPDRFLDALNIDTKHFTIKWGIAILED